MENSRSLESLTLGLHTLGYDVENTSTVISVKTPFSSRVNVSLAGGAFRVEEHYDFLPRSLIEFTRNAGIAAIVSIFWILLFLWARDDPVLGIFSWLAITGMALSILYETYLFIMTKRARRRIQKIADELPDTTE